MPFEPVTLGLKFAVRVHHLTARDVLVVNCPGCHKAYWVAPYVLYERYHEHQKLEVVAKDFHLFPSATTIVRYYPMTDPFGGAGNFVGPNPNQDASVTYYMRKRHTFGKMDVSLFDAKGNFIQTYSYYKEGSIFCRCHFF